MRFNRFITSAKTPRGTRGAAGYAGGSVFPPADAPGGSLPNLPSRTFYVFTAASAYMVASALPCLAQEAGKAAASTTFFDVTPGGILAQLATAAVAAIGTWAAMRKPPCKEDGAKKEAVKLTNDPLRVELQETFASKDDFNKLRDEVRGLSEKIAKQHACYAARADIDRLIDVIRETNAANEKRAKETFERINPIAEAVAAAKATLDNHLSDHRAGKKGGL